MINAIVVGRGNKAVTVEPTRDKDTRRILANKIKGFLFPSNATYKAALARGAAA